MHRRAHRRRKQRPAHNTPLHYRAKAGLRAIFGDEGKTGRFSVQGEDLLKYRVKPHVYFSPNAGRVRKQSSQEIKTVSWEIERTPQRLAILRSSARRTQAPTWVTRRDAGMYDYKHNVKRDGVEAGPGRYDGAPVDAAAVAVAPVTHIDERFKSLARCCAEAPNAFSRGFCSPLPRPRAATRSHRAETRVVRVAQRPLLRTDAGVGAGAGQSSGWGEGDEGAYPDCAYGGTGTDEGAGADRDVDFGGVELGDVGVQEPEERGEHASRHGARQHSTGRERVWACGDCRVVQPPNAVRWMRGAL